MINTASSATLTLLDPPDPSWPCGESPIAREEQKPDAPGSAPDCRSPISTRGWVRPSCQVRKRLPLQLDWEQGPCRAPGRAPRRSPLSRCWFPLACPIRAAAPAPAHPAGPAPKSPSAFPPPSGGPRVPEEGLAPPGRCPQGRAVRPSTLGPQPPDILTQRTRSRSAGRWLTRVIYRTVPSRNLRMSARGLIM